MTTTLAQRIIESLGPSDAERFWSRVDKADGCWTWTGPVAKNGYGRWTVRIHGEGRTATLLAHRVAWYLTHGSVSATLTIDHLCRVKACVNPSHLEPVTLAVNNGRVPHEPRESRGASVQTRTTRGGETRWWVRFREQGRGSKNTSRTFGDEAEALAFAAHLRQHGTAAASEYQETP